MSTESVGEVPEAGPLGVSAGNGPFSAATSGTAPQGDGDRPPSTGEFEEDKPPAQGAALPPVGPFDTEKWREITRAGLAFGLTLLLAIVLILVLVGTVFLTFSATDAKDILGVVLAPLVGLVGAATGFYYAGKEK